MTIQAIEVGGKKIGPGAPCFLIAEIGINHNGDVELAKKLIDLAAESGCDAVKFQKRTVDVVYTAEELAKPRPTPFGETNGDLKRGLEFGEAEYRQIDAYCRQKGILWFASPWDVASVDFLEKFNPPCHKIASACLTDKELLHRIRQTGRPVLLSTGMSSMEEVEKAVKLLEGSPLVLMHTTSTYPSADNELNLAVIETLRNHFNLPVGYSGHEVSAMPSVAWNSSRTTFASGPRSRARPRSFASRAKSPSAPSCAASSIWTKSRRAGKRHGDRAASRQSAQLQCR